MMLFKFVLNLIQGSLPQEEKGIYTYDVISGNQSLKGDNLGLGGSNPVPGSNLFSEDMNLSGEFVQK